MLMRIGRKSGYYEPRRQSTHCKVCRDRGSNIKSQCDRIFSHTRKTQVTPYMYMDQNVGHCQVNVKSRELDFLSCTSTASVYFWSPPLSGGWKLVLCGKSPHRCRKELQHTREALAIASKRHASYYWAAETSHSSTTTKLSLKLW